MQNKYLSGIVLVLIQGVYAASAFAAAPAEGTVQEGVSVPGVALGDSRAQVEAIYGSPSYCQSITHGDLASCTFPVTGGGQVTIRYRGPEGGSASNSPYDVAHAIRWYQGVNWVTSAGVTADMALNNPQALLQAYPNAEVTYHGFTGEIYRVMDGEQGISVTRWYNFYSGTTTVHMMISPGLSSE